MVSPGEFRIGNLVNYTIDRKSIFQGKITAITKNRLVVDKVTSKYMNIEPITLTEEWLLKFGFERNTINNKKFIYYFFGYGYFYFDNNVFSMNFSSQDDVVINIKYVHQLQNLFFALTGEELTINL